jgi:hypothetical protein
MATDYKIIKQRGNTLANINLAALTGRELIISTDTGQMWFCSTPGTTPEVVTHDQLTTILGAASQTTLDALNELIRDLEEETVLTGILTDIASLEGQCGDATLTTTAGTLSGAINELDGEVGDLSTLTTAEKDNLVGAVNELDSDITTINNNLTVTSLTVANSKFNAQKSGNVVVINKDAIIMPLVSGWNLIDTITTANSFPSSIVYGTGFLFDTGYTKRYITKVRIDTDGKVYVFHNATDTLYLTFQLVYLIP